jgi:hypothetical protein
LNSRANAHMDLYRIIRELVQERDRLQRIIESLEQMKPSSKIQVRAGSKRRGRKSMDHAAREEVSERMKRYWARRRAERSEAAPDHAGNVNDRNANDRSV